MATLTALIEMGKDLGYTGKELEALVTEREREEKEREGRREEMVMRKLRAEMTKAQLESEILGEGNKNLRDENKFKFKIEALEANMNQYSSSNASVEGLLHRVIALENMCTNQKSTNEWLNIADDITKKTARASPSRIFVTRFCLVVTSGYDRVSTIKCYVCDNSASSACGNSFKAYQFQANECGHADAPYKCGKQEQPPDASAQSTQTSVQAPNQLISQLRRPVNRPYFRRPVKSPSQLRPQSTFTSVQAPHQFPLGQLTNALYKQPTTIDTNYLDLGIRSKRHISPSLSITGNPTIPEVQYRSSIRMIGAGYDYLCHLTRQNFRF
ncbi:hypothetical protein Btru_069485 [Bulinus truncatus]|nr:hypothetical protein Btru_069485 [Bulinus truncatus]